MGKDWNGKSEYLSKTRSLYLNDDYLQFLVEKVWRIEKPVDVIDFGCGYGYLGLKLLPLLPRGSAYSGIDISDDLINKGIEIFRDGPYDHEFIVSSVYEVPKEKDSYDLAICNSVMMHYESFEHDGFGLFYSDEIIKEKIDYFCSLGFTMEESEEYLKKEMKMNAYFRNNKDDLNMTYSAAMTFCFGSVVK